MICVVPAAKPSGAWVGVFIVIGDDEDLREFRDWVHENDVRHEIFNRIEVNGFDGGIFSIHVLDSVKQVLFKLRWC